MKTTLIKSAADNYCSEIGFVKARIFKEFLPFLEKRGIVSFCETDFEKRINPFFMMEDAKTVIVCLFSYNTGIHNKISSYAHGKDYHRVLTDILEKISKPLTENGYKIKAFTDNSLLPERYLAYLAGLGFFGKNNMLINKKLGSKFFIGCILTDCEIEEDNPIENVLCIGCDKCINSCPGGALGDGFSFDENKCASFVSQKKGELSEEEKALIKKSGFIWGCDICSDVCPYNEKIEITKIPEFSQNLIDVVEIDSDMTNKEFMKKYGDRAFSWRGKNVLLRNINIIKEYRNE